MKETLFGILIILWLLVGLVWFIALVKPHTKLFKSFKPRFVGRKGLSKLFAPLFVAVFVLMAFVAPPVTTELKAFNLEADQDVITEQYTIEGEISGDFVKFEINDEAVTLDDKKFNKALDLKPGNNEVKVLLIGKDSEENEIEIHNSTHNIFFDYEGMLYAQELEKDRQTEAELQSKLAKVPQYETVRKADIDNGFSAIVYVEGDMEDYLLSNVVKNLSSKNQDVKNISILLFNKSDKSEVEAILEKSSPEEIIKYIRANYEKRDSDKQLFWFPEGAEGEKLALEIS